MLHMRRMLLSIAHGLLLDPLTLLSVPLNPPYDSINVTDSLEAASTESSPEAIMLFHG